MQHQILLNIAPSAYAVVVVATMASAGLTLGLALDGLLARLGIETHRRAK